MSRRYLGLAMLMFLLCLMNAIAPRASAQPEPEPDPRSITVAVHALEPFVMETGSDTLTGFSIDLWEEIAQRLDWESDYQKWDDVRGQLQAVADGKAEVAIGAISLTSARERMFDFSQPTLDAGLQIMVPVHDTTPSTPGLAGFLGLIFSKTMLVWLMAAVVVSVLPAHIFWLVERRHASPAVSRAYLPGIFQSFGWSVGSLVGRSSTAPRRWVTKSLAILWGFAGIVFVAFYSANLTATLTVAKLESKISGPADLYDKTVATVADTTSASYLRGMGVSATEMHSIEECYEALREDGYDAVVFDAPVLRYYAAHRGDGVGVMAGPVFQDENHGFVFAVGSKLRKPIDQALLRMREDGSYDMIKEKWFGDDVATSAANPN
ncbi:transporter substrate-binding domain-containing protein [Mycobacterium sp. NPDC049093]